MIRDAVHGDIFIPTLFMKIIDTPEFQRLRRIKQLSTAYLLYPTADHTRFSHSLGTFHVMSLLINHFKPIFLEVNMKINERDINLALAVSLLHDIGHGPFSHAFEYALPKDIEGKMHEEWTINIILSPQSKINHVLKTNFDEQFPNDLADLIKKERSVKKNGLDTIEFEIDLFFVLSALISSQLDADRMDYLLRDAFFTGVTYGKYDISRLIKSLTITVNDNKYYICVMEKYLPTIEEYLVARFQMHDNVYLHPFKIQMEQIVNKILHRSYCLFRDKKLSKRDMPDALLLDIYVSREISFLNYISLDDSTLISQFLKWREADDKILALLCAAFLDRNKYYKLELLGNTDNNIKDFSEEIKRILKDNGYEVRDLNEEYFWIYDQPKNVVYKTGNDNIWVLKNNGTICDLFDISKIIHKDLNQEKNVAYINFDILKIMDNITDVEKVIREIQEEIKMYSNRSHIEIEKKYYFEDVKVFEKVINAINGLKKYEVDDSRFYQEQIDYYYDTENMFLHKSERTMRIRKKGNDYWLTIKTPTKGSGLDPTGQNERFEYEIKVPSQNIFDNKEYINKYIPEIFNEDFKNRLINTIIINNNRKIIILKHINVEFEMAFDDVIYENTYTQKKYHEYQVEIELKSDFIHRVNLKMITDYLEREVPELNQTKHSKYQQALKSTQ